MKALLNKSGYKFFALITMLAGLPAVLLAQDTKVEVNGNDVGSWFSQNWMWVTGVIILLILIILFSGGSRRRKVTTVERNGHHGRTTVTTTTEEAD